MSIERYTTKTPPMNIKIMLIVARILTRITKNTGRDYAATLLRTITPLKVLMIALAKIYWNLPKA